MKVLVTGANGLLGAHVVRELIQRKYTVRVLVRPQSNLSSLDGLQIEYFNGQLTHKPDVEKACLGCSYVIHAAARAIHVPTSLEAYREVNIESTRSVISACKKAGVRRLVFVSTANCFANGTKKNPGTEKGAFPSWMKKSGYAYSKWIAQQLVLETTTKDPLDAVVVNPTFILGKDTKPGGGRIFAPILHKSLAFYPTGGKNFVDAGAAAVGVVNALERGRRGECYLLAGENLSYRKFFQLVAAHAGQRTLLVPVPCFLLKLAGKIGDFSEKILKKPVQLTFVNARMLCLNNYYTPAKAVSELGFPVVPVRESIEKTLGWFMKKRKKDF